MTSREKTDVGGTPPFSAVRFVFPATGKGEWALTVPAALAKCIGRYARIPEYAGGTHLLIRSPVTTANGVDVDAAQRP